MSLLSLEQLAIAAKVSDRCPHCEHHTSLQVESNIRIAPEWHVPMFFGSTQAFLPAVQAHELLRAFKCMYCNATTLVWLDVPASEDAVGIHRDALAAEILWPRRSPRELPPEAPEEVRSIFQEASTCEEAGALRGAAGLLRACVEEIVKERSATGHNLQDKINDLQTKVPALDADLIRDLHDARLTGNWSLHDGVVFSAEEVADIAAMIEEAIELIYVQPARRTAMADARTVRRQGQAPP